MENRPHANVRIETVVYNSPKKLEPLRLLPDALILPTRTTLEPLQVPSNMEVAHYTLDTQRRIELEEYLHNIGRSDMFREVKAEQSKPIPDYVRSNYTKEQKIWMKRQRDKGVNQAPFESIADKDPLELHHIMPQSYAQIFLRIGRFPELISNIYNGITLSRTAHRGAYIVGRNESIHPEMDNAIRSRWKNPNAISEALADHKVMAQEGRHFWNDKWDIPMFARARKLTEEYQERLRQQEERRRLK